MPCFRASINLTLPLTVVCLLYTCCASVVRHTTVSLSVARRDLGGAAVGSNVIFAGGCVGGQSVYTCEQPSSVVDIFNAEASDASTLRIERTNTVELSAARGWPNTCAIGDAVAFLGGGVSGTRPHSRVLDILDTKTNIMRSNSTALDDGRWGIACVAVGDALYFAGGKDISFWGTPSMNDQILKLPLNQKSRLPDVDGLALTGKLSQAREATGVFALGSYGIVFAGGWVSAPMPGGPSAVVDSIDLIAGRNYTWQLPQKPGPNTYWIGAAPWDEEFAFLVDDTKLYQVTRAVFNASEPPAPRDLPIWMSSGGVPHARMAQNGVRVGNTVCFYNANPSSLVCYDVGSEKWTSHPCSADHTAGAIAATNNTVYVAGGVDTKGKPVGIVDVFSFGGSSPAFV